MPSKRFKDNRPDTMKSDLELIIEGMFPVRNRHQLLQTMGRNSTKVIVPFAVLGVIQRRFGLTVLKRFQEEYCLDRIAHEGQGRIEYAEIAAGYRAEEKEKEESGP